MSEVLDEPVKKRQPKTKAKAAAKGDQAKSRTEDSRKSSSDKTAESDPLQLEIKQLQGWLVKCGIRKLWHRELASCESPQAKIKHLKRMLADAGMEGQYSLEKARRIKAKRELDDDLAAVQECDKKWGCAVPVPEKGAPRRQLAKGLGELSALAGSSDESS